MFNKNYTVESRNMFVIKNITDKKISLLTTLNVSKDIDTKVNLLDTTYSLNKNGLYDLYLSVGNTNDQEITKIMEDQFKKIYY